jgi:formylglycine-generating enzyme required for sulfatase activity
VTNAPVEKTNTKIIESLPFNSAEEILVPAGSFQMGCSSGDNECNNNEWPQHVVNLNAYYIDKYEVSNARYYSCIKAGKCLPPQFNRSQTQKFYYEDPDYANYPVINVNWQQASNYC